MFVPSNGGCVIDQWYKLLENYNSGMSGNSLPNLFPILFCPFFPKLVWEQCFSFPFPIPKFGIWIYYSHSHTQKLGIGFKIPTIRKINIGHFIGKKSYSRYQIYPTSKHYSPAFSCVLCLMSCVSCLVPSKECSTVQEPGRESCCCKTLP